MTYSTVYELYVMLLQTPVYKNFEVNKKSFKIQTGLQFHSFGANIFILLFATSGGCSTLVKQGPMILILVPNVWL